MCAETSATGSAKKAEMDNKAEQCDGYETFEGNVEVPAVSTFLPSNISTVNSNYRLAMCTFDKKGVNLGPAGCQTDTYTKKWSSTVPWNPATSSRMISTANNQTLTLGGGDYWLCRMEISNNSHLIMAAGAKVRLFFDTPEHCGSCDVQCPAAKPVCGPVAGGYECEPLCEPSQELCSGTCTDLDGDPGHCGTCDNVCQSGYCFQGSCVGGTFGHVVLMCIDYQETSRSSPIQRLLGNAVFLPGARLARILAFDGYTPSTLRNNVDLTLTWAAGEGGESYRLLHESDSNVIPSRLTIENFDTFLVYAQPDAPGGKLAALGAAWKPEISTFVDDGGTVVVLSGGEMREFISEAGLLAVTAEMAVSGAPLFNRTPTDAVGVNVLSPFQARANSCRFTTSEPVSPTLSYVITGDPPPAALAAPVVVHRILTRP